MVVTITVSSKRDCSRQKLWLRVFFEGYTTEPWCNPTQLVLDKNSKAEDHTVVISPNPSYDDHLGTIHSLIRDWNWLSQRLLFAI